MNFLAHSLFTNSDELLVVGQYCGDFVRGGNLQQFPPTVQHGISLHRRIDSYTDSHPVNLLARNLFSKPYRRFAGIITDVLYDHFLAQNWQEFSNISLQSHAEFVYGALQAHFDLLPPDLQRFVTVVIERNALVSYLDVTTVELVLERISRRSQRFEILATAGKPMRENYSELRGCFDEFFPDLVEHVDPYISTA